MRLGLNIGYSGRRIDLPLDLILEADRLGYYAVWTSEAYGSDCITPLAWIGALTKNIKLGSGIMQMPARSPAMTAMTAMTLDQLSGGRVLLGLGLSGPQVVEGWHGRPYGKPLAKTREYVAILRQILKREAPLYHQGAHYQIPYAGDDATSLGLPLKSIIHGRADMPIYLASIGPKNVALTAEIADGWLPMLFSPAHYQETYGAALEAGFAKEGDKSRGDFDIAPSVTVVIDDDLALARNQIKPMLALYIGGMGAKSRNFYYDLACRYGFEAAADTIQDLYLQGRKGEAIMAAPDALVDAVALVGSKARIRDRLQIWRDSPITSLNVSLSSLDALRFLAEELL